MKCEGDCSSLHQRKGWRKAALTYLADWAIAPPGQEGWLRQ